MQNIIDVSFMFQKDSSISSKICQCECELRIDMVSPTFVFEMSYEPPLPEQTPYQNTLVSASIKFYLLSICSQSYTLDRFFQN